MAISLVHKSKGKIVTDNWIYFGSSYLDILNLEKKYNKKQKILITERINTNSLKQRKIFTEKLKDVSGKNSINNHNKTLKKYKNRKSPPYPANNNCGKKMKGNDGNMYESKPNKNNVCSWKKI